MVTPRIICALATALALSACGKDAPQQALMPALPPLQLQPRIEQLKQLGAGADLALDAATKKELQEYADIALQLVEADERTAARAERSLLEHASVDAILAPMLKHENPAVRSRAAWLLGKSGQSIAQFALVLRLKDEQDGNVALWIAEALHRLGNDAGLVWIDGGMNVEVTAQQAGSMAIELLREDGAQLSEQPTWDELQRALRERTQQWRRTGKSCRDGTQPFDEARARAILARHLSITESFLLRPIDEAKYVISRSGVHGLSTLQIALSASEPYLRSVALQILPELGRAALPLCPHVLPLLGDPLTQFYAMRALGELGCSEAAPHLIARLDARETEARASAAGALGLLGDATIAQRLSQRMVDPAQPLDVRVQCAFALCMLRDDKDAAAFLTEREQKGDYHKDELAILQARLRAGR